MTSANEIQGLQRLSGGVVQPLFGIRTIARTGYGTTPLYYNGTDGLTAEPRDARRYPSETIAQEILLEIRRELPLPLAITGLI